MCCCYLFNNNSSTRKTYISTKEDKEDEGRDKCHSYVPESEDPGSWENGKDGEMGKDGGKWGELGNGTSLQDPDRNRMNDHYKWQKNGENRGAMGEKREKNAMRYPCSPIPLSPFFRRPETFPLLPLTKQSIRHPDGSGGNRECTWVRRFGSLGGLPAVRIHSREASWGGGGQDHDSACRGRGDATMGRARSPGRGSGMESDRE